MAKCALFCSRVCLNVAGLKKKEQTKEQTVFADVPEMRCSLEPYMLFKLWILLQQYISLVAFITQTFLYQGFRLCDTGSVRELQTEITVSLESHREQ